MAKDKSLNITLKEFDKYVLSASAIFSVMPLRVRAILSGLTEDEKKDLENYANIEDGVIERWLLVPDIMPLGILRYVIERSFGLIPHVLDPYFFLPTDDSYELFPTLDKMLGYFGSLFSLADYDYEDKLKEVAFCSPNFIPSILESSFIRHKQDYGEMQRIIADEIADLRKNGVEVDGKIVKFENLVGEMSLLSGKTKTKDFDWSNALDPENELRDILAPENKKIPPIEKRHKNFRSTIKEGRRGKSMPITKQLLFEEYNEGELAFEFEITAPKDISELLDEGYITSGDYLESVNYVLKTMKADCIYKKGYDLFGSDVNNYHDFILELHNEHREVTLQIANMMGWREPFLDLKKVLR